MDKQGYLKFHESCCQQLMNITAKKNHDYTGDNADPFANFCLVERAFNVASAEQGFFTRMTDKLARVGTFISKGTLLVKDENVKDTLLDLANYCILFAGYLESKKTKEFYEKNTPAPMVGPERGR